MTIDHDQLAADVAAGTPEPLQQLWDDYLEAGTPNGSNENGSVDLYDIDGMNEAACAVFHHAETLTARVTELEAELAALIASLPGIRAAERERCSARIDVQVQIYRRDVPDHERKPNVTYRILRERVDTYQSARDIIRALGDAP